MKIRPRGLRRSLFLTLLAAACHAEAAPASVDASHDDSTAHGAPGARDEPSCPGERPAPPPLRIELPLPKAAFDLPVLPYDKATLEHVQELDRMITQARDLGAAVEQFEEMFQRLEEASETSLNGTHEDQVRALLRIVDAFAEFDSMAPSFGERAAARFKANTLGDEDFRRKYTEVYRAAEEEIDAEIEDGPTRRQTGAALRNAYGASPGSNVAFLDRRLAESVELERAVLRRVVSSAETDLMVADYKKGKDLVDLLRGTSSKLELAGRLDPGNAQVQEALRKVRDKEASRAAEIAEARAAYRFPERFSGPSVPSDAAALEKRLREHLEASGYDVRAIALASGWIDVHSVLGVHLYSQIDAFVAVPAAGEEDGVLDVLYVTGKTGGTARGAGFATYSVGSLAQMLAENL